MRAQDDRKPSLASAALEPPAPTHFMQQPAGDKLPAFPPQAQAHAPYGQQVQAPYSQPQYYAPQQRATTAMVQPGEQPYTYQPDQQPGYAPSQYPLYAQEPLQQPRLAYEQQQMPQPQQQFAQTQRRTGAWDAAQNWGILRCVMEHE